MIQISQEIEDLIGADVASRVRNDAGSYVCVYCRVKGDPAQEDTSIVLVRTGDTELIHMGHAQCGPSQIIDAPDVKTPTSLPDRDLLTQTAVMPIKGKPTAWLFIQPEAGMKLYTPTGDEIDPWLAVLMESGWQLVMDLDQKAHAPRSKWRLWLDEDGEGQLVEGEAQVWLDRLPPTAPIWRHTAVRRGFVNVLIGNIDISDLTNRVGPAGVNAVRDFLKDSMANGTVLIGRVDVASGRRPGQAAPDSDAALRARIAEELEASMRARAGVGDHHFNQLPEIVPLPETMSVDVAQIPQGEGVPDMPVVMLNLHAQPATATAVLDELEANGFPRNRKVFGGGPWALGPGKWSHISWHSQVLVMGENSAGERAKLIFEPLSGNSSWYDYVNSKWPHGDGLIWPRPVVVRA